MRLAVAVLILAIPPTARAGTYRVVGGAPVADESWQDAVALFSHDQFLCTGVLVAPDVVLTAGHCNFDVTSVVVGARDYTVDGETIAVTDTIVHDRSWATYDVAALILEHPALAPPRALALDCIADEWLVDGADVAIVGYGATDEAATVYPTVLEEAFTQVVDHDCTTLDEGCNAEVSPGGEIIAGGDGVDSCNGDSGGPLYLLTSQGDYLVGTTSRATNTWDTPCGDGGIYVRADAVADWIEAVTSRVLPRPECVYVNHPPEPTVEPATVRLGHTVDIAVLANDPDANDQQTWTLDTSPDLGEAAVQADGHVTYTANWTTPGTDTFTLTATDDGTPPLSASVQVEVRVETIPIERGQCACDSTTGPTNFGLALSALAALIRRRR